MKRFSKILVLIIFFIMSVAVSYGQIKVACVGNSITYGSAIANRAQNNYPAQLDDLLGKGWTVKNFGVSGATMLQKGNKPYWDQDAFFDAIRFQPDIAIIMLGTSDSKPDNWKYKSQFKVNYYGMIEAFRALKSSPDIYICLPVPVVENQGGIQKQVVEGVMQEMIKSIAKTKDVHLVDMYTPFLDKEEKLFADKIHPNAQGAKMMAKTIAKVLQKDHQKTGNKE